MKKALLIVLIIVLLISSVSCITNTAVTEISSTDMDYALKLAAETACEEAFSKMETKTLNTMQFIPEEQKDILTKAAEIPGIDILLSRWNSYAAQFIASSLTTISKLTINKVRNLNFENPEEYVTSSDTSITRQFEKLHREYVVSCFETILWGIDTTNLEKAVNHYNSYYYAKDFMNGTTTSKLSTHFSTKSLAELLADTFFNLMAQSEELFRTTPNPYINTTSAVVFGIE